MLLTSQGSGPFVGTPLQRLLSPAFITPVSTFRAASDRPQVSPWVTAVEVHLFAAYCPKQAPSSFSHKYSAHHASALLQVC